MADGSILPEDELSLPRAAVNKMIKEMIPNIRVSNDARELVLNCCTEFIHLLASEANDICNKQTKKTISPEHVIAALESLGFTDYVKDVTEVYNQFKTQAQTRKKNSKLKNQGISDEELLRQQQALIAQAKYDQAQEEWLHMQQQGLVPPGCQSSQAIPIIPGVSGHPVALGHFCAASHPNSADHSLPCQSSAPGQGSSFDHTCAGQACVPSSALSFNMAACAASHSKDPKEAKLPSVPSSPGRGTRPVGPAHSNAGSLTSADLSRSSGNLMRT